MYKTESVHEEREIVQKGRGDRARILETVRRRVLRLQYTLDANAQMTQSKNSKQILSVTVGDAF